MDVDDTYSTRGGGLRISTHIFSERELVVLLRIYDTPKCLISHLKLVVLEA